MSQDPKFIEEALRYHAEPRPGKIETVSTKPLSTQRDLSLGYTPGVAAVCEKIAQDPSAAEDLTTRGNLVAVVTNGSAVLGLGNIGPLASKPVMEGKAVLFKKFANIDVFDLEIDASDPDKFVEVVAALAPTFGGINLEDIKAPECFEIERKLKEKLDIPVMHDDQHGTAIIVAAAFINAMRITKKDPKKVKICCVGAGAAGLACMRLLVEYGVQRKNITMVDVDGVIYEGRPQMNDEIAEFAHKTKMRTLDEAIDGADMFFGLSAGGVLKPEMLKKMAKNPVIFAMANPSPEIMPDVAKQVRPDAIIGTGRSDFPNQINNVLGFPYLFRGALDAGATEINSQMKLAAAEALAELARKTADAALDKAYKGAKLKFGPEYIIPKPFDPRLLGTVAPAVARAAAESGVARRPIEDMEAYRQKLYSQIDQSFAIMRDIRIEAKRNPQRIIFPEGEDARVIQAAQELAFEGLAEPILIGRPDKVAEQMDAVGSQMIEGEHYKLVDPNNYPEHHAYAQEYYGIRKRSGLLPPEAEIIIRSRWTSLGAMMIRMGAADAMVAGVTGRFDKFLRATREIIGTREGLSSLYALQLIMMRDRVVFIGDTHINDNPTAEQIAEMARLAADQVKHFGIEPRIALLSHSNFGSSQDCEARKMARAREIINEKWPDLVVEGEMQADSALDMETLARVFPEAVLREPANILLMPNVGAANISFNLLRCYQEGMEYIGPMILGLNNPVHILSVSAPVRRIIKMAALAGVEAFKRKTM